MTKLPDIQKTIDYRNVRINQVGVTSVKLPVRIPCRDGNICIDTVGVFELGCSLSSEVKGTHMSRFTQVLNSFVLPCGRDNRGHFHTADMQKFLLKLGDVMESQQVSLRMEVDYFVQQHAPATGESGVSPVKGVIDITMFRKKDLSPDPTLPINIPDSIPTFRIHTGITVNGMTCCPCSKEISDFDHLSQTGRGAHAQRSEIKVSVNHSADNIIWFEDLLDICWESYSSPVYPILKRPDERHVTISSYNNPKFVEDVIRDVVVGLRNKKGIGSYRVRVTNAESIHYHDAFAEVHGNAEEERNETN